MKLKQETIQNLRQDYHADELHENDIAKDPISQFEKWFSAAMDAQIDEPNVMTLATADKSGRPHARIVLLKGFDKKGFTFYTNYLSQKGKELKKNPYACLVFFWGKLERQIRIEGRIEKLDKETSEQYFHTRPFGSQIGAIASHQSQVVGNREIIEERVAQLTKEFEGKPIPKPAFWGGYLLIPESIEFWQGRSSRLHDRLKYTLVDKKWKIERLEP